MFVLAMLVVNEHKQHVIERLKRNLPVIVEMHTVDMLDG